MENGKRIAIIITAAAIGAGVSGEGSRQAVDYRQSTNPTEPALISKETEKDVAGVMGGFLLGISAGAAALTLTEKRNRRR